jgi:hypothetical protein
VLRKLFILFIATWLPVQAGAALASSLTGYSALPQAPEQADVATMHDHHGGHLAHTNDTGAVQHDGHEHDAPGGCERCGLCQFVHGGVMLNAGASLPAMPPRHAFAALGDEPFIAHIPELLQRPPLSAA